MDEARLKEIEQQYPEGLSRVGDELIAALRQAWKERGDYHSKWDHARQGYERVKDELVHKDAVIKALQAQYVDHMRPLVALREAAEEQSSRHPKRFDGDVISPCTCNLCRALAACRE